MKEASGMEGAGITLVLAQRASHFKVGWLKGLRDIDGMMSLIAASTGPWVKGKWSELTLIGSWTGQSKSLNIVQSGAGTP